MYRPLLLEPAHRLRERFVEYTERLGRVWSDFSLLEAAVPLLLSAVAPRSEWQPINGLYCWGEVRGGLML